MVLTDREKSSFPTLSKLRLKSTGQQPSFASIPNENGKGTMEVTNPPGLWPGATTPVLTGASASRCSANSLPHAASSESLGTLHDAGTEHLLVAFAPSARDAEGVAPSASMADEHGVAEQPPIPAAPASPKRKYPKLLTQLAHELRWMHKSLRHKYDDGAASGVHSVPSTSLSHSSAPSCAGVDDEENEDLLITTTLRSSMRRSSHQQSAARSHSGASSAPHTFEAASSTKPDQRLLANDEVERVQPVEPPEVTPDPYAPRSCQYVVQDLAVVVTEEDVLISPCFGVSSVSATRAGSTGKAERTAVVSEIACVASDLSFGEDSDMEGPYRGNSGSPNDFELGSNGASDAEVAGAVAASASYGRGLKGDCALSTLGICEGTQAGNGAAGRSDSYQVFFSGIVALQRQLHHLEQLTASLRTLYEQEQRARLRSKGKGQHLSWTRTVEAANTIHFWRHKVSTLRLFESQYLSVLKAFQQDLQLVDPEAERAQQLIQSPASAAAASGITAVVMQARWRFLCSTRVIAVQEQHLKALSEQLRTCWTANALLREELQHFEQREVRVPHDTFATAGMDVEHFIASLPPRTSACSLHNVTSHNSALSLDSLGSAETSMLLTAQNLSPISSDNDDGGNAASRGSSGSTHSDHHPIHRSPRTAAASAAPLVSCMKRISGASSTPASSVMPKRLKYIICSASFDADEGSDGGFAIPVAPSYIGSNASATNSQTRRRSERHVTFALEPEVLDARPRFSAHGRTMELLEQICLDKQMPWSALPLLQCALEERLAQLAQLRARWGGAIADESLSPSPSVTPQAPATAGSRSGGTECYPYDEGTAPTPKSLPSTTRSRTVRKATSRQESGKVKPKVCTTCFIM
ncbi:hypothetical protein CUR178_04520 [Leishmania enriettii]|uniref:Uncharacterized protein n=1 Tax=Leishmania enriettii TaxID=5663 RepID=A0A836KLK7_LEIEN|nr:hypothetical protein CUR178_04520 [Leishmania enriettii]